MSLPEAIPEVSFDIAVGEQAAWIDFDYDAFYEMATSAGLSQAQINRLSIRFVAEPDATPIQNALQRPIGHHYLLGNYSPLSNRAKVYLSAIHELQAQQSFALLEDPDAVVPSLQELVNRTVIHETGHHFFESHMSAAFERPVKQAIETIEWQSAWRTRDLEALKQYLSSK